jgi:tetratricopeptide (TPR) repeat protein
MDSRFAVAGFLEGIFPSVVLFAVALFNSSAAEAQQNSLSNRSFDQTAALAKQASEAHELGKAIPLYRQALELRPHWAEGWWSLGTILYDQDSYSDAAQAFRRVIALDPKHGTAKVMLGLCEFELGHDANALRNIESGKRLGVLKDPQLRHVMLYHEGVLLVRKGSFEAAQQVLDSLSQEGVQDDDLILALGISVLRIRPRGLPPEGSTAREVVLRTGKAEWLSASKNFEAARREYSSVATEFSDTANVHYAYGRFLLQVREIDPAVVEFQHEIRNNPQHVLARLQIAAVRYRLDSADGVKYAQEAVKLDPQRPFGHYLLGLLYLDTQNYVGAISELEIAKRFHPNLPEIYFALGNAYARAGRQQEAARARVIFTRLNALGKKESADTVYGEQPSGLAEKQLEAPVSPNPRN